MSSIKPLNRLGVGDYSWAEKGPSSNNPALFSQRVRRVAGAEATTASPFWPPLASCELVTLGGLFGGGGADMKGSSVSVSLSSKEPKLAAGR